jgi:hypothetical protein
MDTSVALLEQLCEAGASFYLTSEQVEELPAVFKT